MASMRDIKRRKSSIQGTQQITKAMKLVSTVKLQRARASAERSKGYFTCMYSTVNNILQRVGHIDHPYLMSGESPRKAVVVITSNRGLAGGYNSNVTKLVTRHPEWKKGDLDIYCLGNKGREALARGGYDIKECDNDIVESPVYADAAALSAKLLESYAAGEIGEIYLAYTGFKNTVSHVPTLLRLLPVDVSGEEDEGQASGEATAIMNFEAEDSEALDLLIPKYVTSLIYGALRESVASENGARMQAMDSATSNAEEIISDLTLKYNRARQGSITQELTEIIAGAEALG
ncbi:MAG: ATP synthase F1 subunit gamma [Lachnospiraceae bacterium]|nr:ATP synthase F1 subunit gamma [uncultured Acetatifactor sp.]MCI9572840.1 ATP synthase F1 subunit gamma [Lachnospiraceae bacterium]